MLEEQYASMIDKDVMKYMRQRYFGYTDEPNDLDYVTGFLGRQHANELAELKAGQFLYKFGREVKQIKVEPYETLRKPKPYPWLLMGKRENKEDKTETNLMSVAAVALQIGALLIFLMAVALTLTG